MRAESVAAPIATNYPQSSVDASVCCVNRTTLHAFKTNNAARSRRFFTNVLRLPGLGIFCTIFRFQSAALIRVLELLLEWFCTLCITTFLTEQGVQFFSKAQQ